MAYSHKSYTIYVII